MLPLACSLRGFSARSRPTPPTSNDSPPDSSDPATTGTTPLNHSHPPTANDPLFFLRETPDYPGYLPPWYRTATIYPGDAGRFRYKIVGGIFIPYSEGKAWLKKQYGINLPDNHCQDLAILSHLRKDMRCSGHFDNLELVQSRETDDAALDILVITKRRSGKFQNTGPIGVEEVVQEDLRNIFKPGRSEMKWTRKLFQEFGR